jgi:hypothetical protein
MRLQAAYLVGALAVTMIPLSAGAQSLFAGNQPGRNTQAATQSIGVCPSGWYWEQAGYISRGKWREAHCAPR